MFDFPENVFPWILGAIALLLFGYRALVNYKQARLTLWGYFSVTAVSGGIGMLLWSMPFVVLDPVTNRQLIADLVLTGNFFVYVALGNFVRVLWYLTLRDKIKLWLLMIPTIILGLAGFYSDVMSGLARNTLPVVIDNNAIYPTSDLGDITQTIFLLVGLVVGITLLGLVKDQKSKKSKIGILAISVLHVQIALGGIIDILSRYEIDNVSTSPLAAASYTVGFLFFIVIFIMFRIFDKKA